MAATNKLFVTQTQQWIVVTEELGVEDDLHSVGRVIEEIASLECLDNRVPLIIVNIMCGYWRPEVHNISRAEGREYKKIFLTRSFSG